MGYFNSYGQWVDGVYTPNTNAHAQSNQYMPPSGPMPVRNGLHWVAGIDGANKYPLAPGESAWLMDQNQMVMFYKTVDAMGRPSQMLIYDLVEQKPQEIKTAEDVPSIDYDKIRKIISEEVDTRLASTVNKKEGGKK